MKVRGLSIVIRPVQTLESLDRMIQFIDWLR